MDRQILRLAAAAIGLSTISACTTSSSRLLSEHQRSLAYRDMYSTLQHDGLPADDMQRDDHSSRIASSLPRSPAASPFNNSQESSPPPWNPKSKRTAEHWSAVPCNPAPYAAAQARTSIARMSSRRPYESVVISQTNAFSRDESTGRTMPPQSYSPAAIGYFLQTQQPQRFEPPAGALSDGPQLAEAPLQISDPVAPAEMPQAGELGSVPTATINASHSGFLSGLRQTVHGEAEQLTAAE